MKTNEVLQKDISVLKDMHRALLRDIAGRGSDGLEHQASALNVAITALEAMVLPERIITLGVTAEEAMKQQREQLGAMGPDTEKASPPDLYCVIAVSAINRSWYNSLADAILHAKQLINNAKETKQMYVVRVVSVVELSSPPIIDRNVTFGDLQGKVRCP